MIRGEITNKIFGIQSDRDRPFDEIPPETVYLHKEAKYILYAWKIFTENSLSRALEDEEELLAMMRQDFSYENISLVRVFSKKEKWDLFTIIVCGYVLAEEEPDE